MNQTKTQGRLSSRREVEQLEIPEDPEAPRDRPGTHSTASKDFELRILLVLVLFFVTAAAYIPAWDGEYIYDDDTLLTQNPAIRRGSGFLDPESWKGLASFWFPTDKNVTADYFPLTSTTFWIEWRLWGNTEPGTPGYAFGLGAPGYHITNILLHAICAILLWIVLKRLSIPGAWFAALLWAVHPVCVESVAWISERKNTLSMALFLAAMLSWIRFVQLDRRKYYFMTLAWFILALLAKTAIVMVPFVLLLTVWWMRGTLKRRDFVQSVPFFVCSFILGVVTLYFQYSRAIGEEYIPIGGPFDRLAGASFALGFYLYKVFFPFNLALIYPQWHETVPRYLQLLPGVGYAVVFAWAWKERATWGRHVIFGLGFYVITLFPILGFLKMAYMRLTLVADHFQYTSMVGVIALVVGGVTHWSARLREESRAWVLGTTGTLLVAGCFWLSWNQSGLYKTKEIMWADVLRKNPNSWQAHNHMGAILFKRREIEKAIKHFERAVELKPYNLEVHNNAGLAYALLGQVDRGLEHLKRAVEIRGDLIPIRLNYASWLEAAGHLTASEENFRVVVQLAPENPKFHFDLARVLAKQQKFDEAIAECKEALRLEPRYGDARTLLGETIQLQKQQQETDTGP